MLCFSSFSRLSAFFNFSRTLWLTALCFLLVYGAVFTIVYLIGRVYRERNESLEISSRELTISLLLGFIFYFFSNLSLAFPEAPFSSRIDNDIVNGKLDLSWARELKLERLPYFDCDVLVEDGDVFAFGDISIRCVLTPGHTDGVLSFFITMGEEGIVAAMHGGIGFNSMSAAFLDDYDLSYGCRGQFLEGLHRLKKERVDLVLGNHPNQTGTLQKLNQLRQGARSILDENQWQDFLQKTEQRFYDFIRTEEKCSQTKRSCK